jgi:pyrophosphatase PpaX
MRRIKNVIFDFDGTLADTLPVLLHASKKIFLHYDRREISQEEFRSFFGPTELVIIEKNLLNRDHVVEAVESFIKEYDDVHDSMVEQDLEIERMLHELHETGIGLALFTGKSRRTLNISLAKLNWQIPFDYIVTGDDVSHSKPSPEGLEIILDALQWNREETIFVGDSNDDQLAGKGADIQTIAAGWMKMKQDRHDHIAPERVFVDLKSFKAYLDEYIVRQEVL